MTVAQCLALASAILGAGGTSLIFIGSYAFEPMQGAVFYGPEVARWNEATGRRNIIRKWEQRVGLMLLCISFIVQAASVFLPAS